MNFNTVIPFTWLTVVLCHGAVIPASTALGDLDPVPTNQATTVFADQLMDEVIMQLPQEELTITGEITVRKRRGIVTQKLAFELKSKWGDKTPTALYTISDTDGKTLESMKIIKKRGQHPDYEYQEGDPLKKADTPVITDAIQETNVSWLDVTLSFLWWRGGMVMGKEKVKGRDCFVVDIEAPEDAVAGSYRKVRLWIDEEARVLLQAQDYNEEGKILRKLWVRSFKKIDERWMIKDLEVQSYPSNRRTKLRIDDVVVEEE